MTREDARTTLLRALEQLDDAESDLGANSEVVHLCVVYSAGRAMDDGGFHEVGGWVNTTGPLWLHAAMLRRAADALDVGARDDDEDEEGQDG
jgi:hypothetical protein